MEWQIFKKIDPFTLVAIYAVWWSLNGKMHDLDKRLTVIETVLLMENRIPSHVATAPKE